MDSMQKKGWSRLVEWTFVEHAGNDGPRVDAVRCHETAETLFSSRINKDAWVQGLPTGQKEPLLPFAWDIIPLSPSQIPPPPPSKEEEEEESIEWEEEEEEKKKRLEKERKRKLEEEEQRKKRVQILLQEAGLEEMVTLARLRRPLEEDAFHWRAAFHYSWPRPLKCIVEHHLDPKLLDKGQKGRGPTKEILEKRRNAQFGRLLHDLSVVQTFRGSWTDEDGRVVEQGERPRRSRLFWQERLPRPQHAEYTLRPDVVLCTGLLLAHPSKRPRDYRAQLVTPSMATAQFVARPSPTVPSNGPLVVRLRYHRPLDDSPEKRLRPAPPSALQRLKDESSMAGLFLGDGLEASKVQESSAAIRKQWKLTACTDQVAFVEFVEPNPYVDAIPGMESRVVYLAPSREVYDRVVAGEVYPTSPYVDRIDVRYDTSPTLFWPLESDGAHRILRGSFVQHALLPSRWNAPLPVIVGGAGVRCKTKTTGREWFVLVFKGGDGSTCAGVRRVRPDATWIAGQIEPVYPIPEMAELCTKGGYTKRNDLIKLFTASQICQDATPVLPGLSDGLWVRAREAAVMDASGDNAGGERARRGEEEERKNRASLQQLTECLQTVTPELVCALRVLLREAESLRVRHGLYLTQRVPTLHVLEGYRIRVRLHALSHEMDQTLEALLPSRLVVAGGNSSSSNNNTARWKRTNACRDSPISQRIWTQMRRMVDALQLAPAYWSLCYTWLFHQVENVEHHPFPRNTVMRVGGLGSSPDRISYLPLFPTVPCIQRMRMGPRLAALRELSSSSSEASEDANALGKIVVPRLVYTHEEAPGDASFFGQEPSQEYALPLVERLEIDELDEERASLAFWRWLRIHPIVSAQLYKKRPEGTKRSEAEPIGGTRKDMRNVTNFELGELLKQIGIPAQEVDRIERWDRTWLIEKIASSPGGTEILNGRIAMYARDFHKERPEQAEGAAAQRLDKRLAIEATPEFTAFRYNAHTHFLRLRQRLERTEPSTSFSKPSSKSSRERVVLPSDPAWKRSNADHSFERTIRSRDVNVHACKEFAERVSRKEQLLRERDTLQKRFRALEVALQNLSSEPNLAFHLRELEKRRSLGPQVVRQIRIRVHPGGVHEVSVRYVRDPAEVEKTRKERFVQQGE